MGKDVVGDQYAPASEVDDFRSGRHAPDRFQPAEPFFKPGHLFGRPLARGRADGFESRFRREPEHAFPAPGAPGDGSGDPPVRAVQNRG